MSEGDSRTARRRFATLVPAATIALTAVAVAVAVSIIGGESARADVVPAPPTEQDCINSALAAPISMSEQFIGAPKKNKVAIHVEVGGIAVGCSAYFTREVIFLEESKRVSEPWRPASKHFDYMTNDATTWDLTTRIYRYCNFNPAKTHVQQITHGYDSRHHSKTRLAVYPYLVTSSGVRQKGYFTQPKSMCRRRG